MTVRLALSPVRTTRGTGFPPLPPNAPGRWLDIYVRAQALWWQADRMGTASPGSETSWGELERIKEILAATVSEIEPVWWGRRMRLWWSATPIEAAWGLLHDIEERLVGLTGDEELISEAGKALEHAPQFLKPDDERLRYLRDELTRARASAAPPPNTRTLRAATIAVLAVTHEASDMLYRQSRALRNRMLGASLVSLLAVGVAFAAQVVLLPRGQVLIHTEGTAPSGVPLLALVALAGLIGAVISALPVMASMPTGYRRNPYSLPVQQALLKLCAGPLTAVAGLALVATDVPLNDTAQVVSLAVLFGTAQHALTRIADHKAAQLADTAAGKS
ncbi:hypothetical protein HFP15_33450 [Amycolatopsis sp. K13G38]|uniref:Uncharacterized protein n=1 Tax=Amycolatopsis acididurans TaxID=2724524 RepID=A0ABX1JDA9_9PSEU|nr:hypothetical protein [Amycolatopsis acididurans]NKQ57778.1 hypothetical protein [Amycolatopsis acididurans]